MTTDARHSKATISNIGVHSMVAYEYADETARLAATGFDAFDLYKVAIQTDTDELYLLVDISPITWIDFGKAGITQELNKVRISCRKASTGTLAVGTVVYSLGWDYVNDVAKVEAARADSVSTLPVVGIIDQQCTDTSTGSLMVVGVLRGLNTSAFAVQDPLYLSHTSAGVFTNTPPPGPYIVQTIGVVVESDVSDGIIGVNILGFRAIQYATPPADLGVAAVGTSNVASASDHVHQKPKLDDLNAPDDNTDLDSTTGQHGLLPKLGGGVTDFLRADGSWAAPPGVPLSDTDPVDVTKAAASEGTATESSRQDHKHDVTTAAPTTGIGAANSEGSATSLARSDHDHKLRETDGPTDLTIGAVEDGEFLKRDGTAIVGQASSGNLVKMFQGIDVTGNMTVTTSSKVIPFTYESIKDDYFAHSTTVNPGEIEILHDGWYRVSALLTVHTVSASAGTRGNPRLHIEVDTGSGFVEQPDNMGGYIREDGTNKLACSITGVGVFYFDSGDKFRITVKDSVPTPPDEETVPYSSRCLVEYIDRTGAASDTVDNLKDIGDVDAAAPGDGEVLTFNGATSKWEADSVGETVFGDEFDETSSDSESSTTSGSPQTKVTLAATGLVSAHKYRVGWSFEWRHNSAASRANYRVTINGDTIDELTVEPKDVNNWHQAGGYMYVSGYTGANDIDIDYWSDTSNTTYIRRARLEIWRVS